MIVAEWVVDKTRIRLVSTPYGQVLEKCERDAAGGDRWVEVPWRTRDQVGSRLYTEYVLSKGIEQLAIQAKELRDSMDYSRGARQG